MPIQGLTSADASRKLLEEGYNELPSARTRNFLAIALGVLHEPMFVLLLAAAAIYFVIGDISEAAVLSLFALLSVLIAIIQEWRSERVLEALRDMTSPRALVIRDGEPRRIPGREVVSGDIMILAEGDRVPADARLQGNDTLQIDESLLTGESLPVAKTGSKEHIVHAGTLIVKGSARACVVATGKRSEIGKIGQALYAVDVEQPHLQKQIRKIVQIFALFGISLSLLSTVLYGLLRDSWLEGVLSGIALGMALMPEEFPLVLTVFMVMGAWRISKVRVLTRKASSIETLGSATVLCTDKTGTLTQNRMSIVFMKAGADEWHSGEEDTKDPIRELFDAGRKASKGHSYDPMDLAFFQFPLSPNSEEQDAHCHYGLRSHLLMMAQVYVENGEGCVYAKGAPEAIGKACGFDEARMQGLHEDVERLAGLGLRILAVASAKADVAALPESADEFSYEFLGLIGFADPLRENVPRAVAQCREAGIRVMMITGDYPATARAIALQAGFENPVVITGDEIRGMDERALSECLRKTSVFARIAPDQKLRIVQALKHSGEIVAMTGDGVNDAPSLKAAHIGVAMGGRGTDVAREASSIVLLDDNFGSLVDTIALGRRIFDNLQKAIVYITAVHVPIAGLAMLPLFLNKPLILTPLLIALMEMIIDPACSIVLEAEEPEKNLMKRHPRRPGEALLPMRSLLWGITQGGIGFGVLTALWGMCLYFELPEAEVRSLIFVTLTVMNFVFILVNRSFSASLRVALEIKNPYLVLGGGGVMLILSVFLFWSPARELFGFGAFHAHDFILALVCGAFLFMGLERLKPLFQKVELRLMRLS